MKSRAPNILLLVIDCARSDRLLNPCRSAHTPNLDRLADAGASLPTMIVETPSTTPCFASLLTGAYSFRHGVIGVGGYRLRDELVTLGEILRRSGYRTIAEVTGPLVPMAGLARGFDEYHYRLALDFLHNGLRDRLLQRLRGLDAQQPWFLLAHLWELHVRRQVLPDFDSPAFGADAYDRALSCLDHQLGPLLEAAAGPNTIVAITGDHGEKTSAEPYRPGTAVDYARRLYEVDRSGGFGVRQAAMVVGPVAMQQLRARFQPALERFSQRETPRPIARGFWTRLRDYLRLLRLAPALHMTDLLKLRKPDQRTEMLTRRGLFDAEVSRAGIDRLVRRFGEQEMFDLYLRMWTGQFRKQLHEGHVLHVYDFLVRVPLILAAQGRIAAGVRITPMVRQVDLAPTLLDLAGLPADPEFAPDGQSLVPLLRGEHWESRPAHLSVNGQPRDICLRGVRTDRYKYVYAPQNPDLPCELYDLSADPAEERNLASAEPTVARGLRELSERLVPQETASASRLDNLSAADQRLIEARLRDLGYVE